MNVKKQIIRNNNNNHKNILPFRGYNYFSQKFARSEGDVFDPLKYICSLSFVAIGMKPSQKSNFYCR